MSLDTGALIGQVTSLAKQLGVFRKINGHEPKSAPGQGLTLSVWLNAIRPARSSSLVSTSAVCTLGVRIQSPILAQPEDEVDPELGRAVDLMVAAISANFTFSGRARNVDLLGQEGQRLEGVAGYIEHDGRHFRVFTLSVPVIVNDVWPQAGG